LPVVYFDERYSSLEAWNALKAGGMKAAKRRKQLDKVAAQVMLQAFLEQLRQGKRFVTEFNPATVGV
jgi:putative holliday junction resolvase